MCLQKAHKLTAIPSILLTDSSIKAKPNKTVSKRTTETCLFPFNRAPERETEAPLVSKIARQFIKTKPFFPEMGQYASVENGNKTTRKIILCC